MSNMIAIDFDATIWPYSKGWADGSIYEPPFHNAKEAIQKLKDARYKIVIYSCRTSRELYDDADVMTNAKQLEKYLNDHNIPFDEIYTGYGKPHAALFIDDRGWRFTNWDEVDLMLASIK